VCSVIGRTEETELGMMCSSVRGSARPRVDRDIQATNEAYGTRPMTGVLTNAGRIVAWRVC